MCIADQPIRGSERGAVPLLLLINSSVKPFLSLHMCFRPMLSDSANIKPKKQHITCKPAVLIVKIHMVNTDTVAEGSYKYYSLLHVRAGMT